MKQFIFIVFSIFFVSYTTADNVTVVCKELGDGLHLKPGTGCKKYYSCSGPYGSLYECPTGLLFDDENKWCDLEANVECESEPPPECNPESAVPEFFPIKGSQCHSYTICVEGIPFKRDCGEGYLYDEEDEKCNIDEKVQCLDCPTNNDPSNIVYYPNKQNCKGYFICLSGQATEFECADGAYYDEKAKTCRIEENVNCRFVNYTTPAVTTPGEPATDPFML